MVYLAFMQVNSWTSDIGEMLIVKRYELMNKELIEKSKSWKFTTITVTVLSAIGIIAWFITDPSYEPLIAFFPLILGVIVSLYNSRWQIDLAISVLLVILFLGGLILILTPNSTEQAQILEPNNVELWEFLVIVISILISTILIFLWFLRRDNKVSKTFLWALIGNSDNKSAEEFFEQLFIVFVSIILWSIVISLIFVVALLILTVLLLAFGTEVSGTETAIMQYMILGGVLGGFIGIVVAIIRLKDKNQQQNKTNGMLKINKIRTPSSSKKYIKYKGLLWKLPRLGIGLPTPFCSRNSCERPVFHERAYPPRYLVSSNLTEMKEFLNKQNTYKHIYRCPVHGELAEVPDIDINTLKQEAKFEIKR